MLNSLVSITPIFHKTENAQSFLPSAITEGYKRAPQHLYACFFPRQLIYHCLEVRREARTGIWITHSVLKKKKNENGSESVGMCEATETFQPKAHILWWDA